MAVGEFCIHVCFARPKENETKEKGATAKVRFPRKTHKASSLDLPTHHPQTDRTTRGPPAAQFYMNYHEWRV